MTTQKITDNPLSSVKPGNFGKLPTPIALGTLFATSIVLGTFINNFS